MFLSFFEASVSTEARGSVEVENKDVKKKFERKFWKKVDRTLFFEVNFCPSNKTFEIQLKIFV